jgi:hypothetical protein
MAVSGMNLAEVRHLADQLNRAAEQLRTSVSIVDGRVHGSSWAGHDADQFKHSWWPGHRQLLLHAADSLQGLAASARNNADEQERASGASAHPSAGQGVGPIAAVAGGLRVVGAAGSQLLDGAAGLSRSLADGYEWMGHAKSWAEIADSKVLRNPDLPVSNLLHDVLGDGRIQLVGHAMDGLSIAANGFETVQDFRSGDYYEGTLDAIDTVADPFKGKGLLGWLATGTIETWTDAARLGRDVDWSQGVPWGSMNPFDADDLNGVLIPTAKDVGQGLAKLLWEDWVP